MTQERFDELRAGTPLESDPKGAFLFYNIITTELAKEGYTKITENGKTEKIDKEFDEASNSDALVLLSHIQHFFHLQGFRTKPYKDTHTAYIFAPDARIVGVLIKNDFKFE
jgi:hypothetical protein